MYTLNCACGCGDAITFMDKFQDVIYVDFQTSLFYIATSRRSLKSVIKKAYKNKDHLFEIILTKQGVEDLLRYLAQINYAIEEHPDYTNSSRLQIEYINESDFCKDENKLFSLYLIADDVKPKYFYELFQMRLSKGQINNLFDEIKYHYEEIFGPINKKKQILLEDKDE